jgi:hypothetical protein
MLFRPTDESILYSLHEYGIAEPIKILGTVTKVLPRCDVPIVFLIDETHTIECIKQNIANAKVLIQHCNISLIGVESHEGGLIWDDRYSHKYTSNFDYGENPNPVNTYPQFADAMKQAGAKVLGVECRGISNELECNLVDNLNGGPIKDRPFNIARSEHFIRTLFELRKRHNLAGHLILNVGGNHNTHIANWIKEEIIETKAGQQAAYVRFRVPAYKE